MPAKTVRQRVEECVTIRRQLTELEIAGESELQELYNLMNEFVRDGKSASGRLLLPRLNRACFYVLSMQPQVPCSLNLKYLTF